MNFDENPSAHAQNSSAQICLISQDGNAPQKSEMSHSSCFLKHYLLMLFDFGSENRKIWLLFSLWGNIYAKLLTCNVKLW